ncbi:putative adhesin [Roseateles chitinivorans]|uniref:putative adhesin n=1 Tax=Roseateles chitinivorans TaxID=2917965 RepID=UPI003D66D743
MALTATKDDIILLGHGGYTGGVDNITLPAGLDLYVLGPVGAVLTVAAAKLLIDAKDIKTLNLTTGGKQSVLMPGGGFPHAYKGGQGAPNLHLFSLGAATDPIRVKLLTGNVLTPVLVTKETTLAELVKLPAVASKAAAAAKAGKSVRVFWAACATQGGTESVISATS